jgi:hypothetical protein
MPKIRAGTIELSYETYGDGEPLLLIMGLVCPGRHGSPACLFSLNLNVSTSIIAGRATQTNQRGRIPFDNWRMTRGICSTRWAFKKRKSTVSRWAG